MIAAVPSTFTPLMARGVIKAVAVAAFPVVLWLSVGKAQFAKFPLLGVPKAPPLTTKAPANPTSTAKAEVTPAPSVSASCFALHAEALAM